MPHTEPHWNEVRRVIEEIDLKLHLARMELGARWDELQPRVTEEISAIGKRLQGLRDELARELTSRRGAP